MVAPGTAGPVPLIGRVAHTSFGDGCGPISVTWHSNYFTNVKQYKPQSLKNANSALPGCRQRGLRLFVLPPRSPKLNGQVERAHRTPTEEFYEVTPCALSITELNRELQAWERTYNTVRPHQALGYLTPQQFLAQSSSPRKDPECH